MSMKERRVWKLTYPRQNRYGVDEHVYVVANTLADISRVAVALSPDDPTSVESMFAVWVDDHD